jgi:hypothetical protein
MSKSHGLVGTTEYHIWLGAKARCNNPSSSGFHRYGGRGIKICDRWNYSFENFLTDMGNRPSTEYTLDRKDNNGDYEPANCRWATHEEQQSNKVTNTNYTIHGVTKCLSHWCKHYNINPATVYSRIKKGWEPYSAITTPAMDKWQCGIVASKSKVRRISFNGETKTATEWAQQIGITKHALLDRLDKFKWTIERAITTPPYQGKSKPKQTWEERNSKWLITYKGKSRTVSQWARLLGIKDTTLRSRVKIKGWALERALTTPARKMKDSLNKPLKKQTIRDIS